MSGYPPLVVIVAAVVSVFSLPMVGLALWPVRRGGRSKRFGGKPGVSEFRQKELASSFTDRLANPIVSDLAHLARRVTPIGMVEDTTSKLVTAGLSSRLPVEVVLGVKVLAAAGGLGLGAVAARGQSLNVALALLVVGTVVGFMLPDIWVGRKAAERQAEISASLPEVLDQLSVIIEAGLGFDSALTRIVESSSGPLIDEFARALRSIRLGRSRSEALQDIATRCQVVEVRQFVGAIKQADALGVPVARIVRTQAHHMRELKRLGAEEQAMRLPVKLTLPMVFCMLPALFIVLLGPVAIRMIENL